MAAAETLRAPRSWRAIEFISDLHLCADAPRTFEAFGRHLAHTDADALFILGDLFELWIGDDTRHDDFERACAAALSSFGSQRALYFICGNRDFLVGAEMLADCAMQGLPDPTCLEAFGQRLLLSHGDALCVADTEYQVFRERVRSEGWQRDFLSRPIDERAAVARRIRTESQGRKAAKPEPMLWADVDADMACRWLEASGCRTLIHGHTHRPGRTALPQALLRETLSDWDFDGTEPRADVLRLGAAGLARTAPIAAP